MEKSSRGDEDEESLESDHVIAEADEENKSLEEASSAVEEEQQEQEEQRPARLFEITDQTFGELDLPASQVEAILATWRAYNSEAISRQAAGEALLAAIFDSAPSLQTLFRTPRAVMSMRFMNGLNSIVQALQDKTDLKAVTETMGFQHLDQDVTIPRLAIFREAIVELLATEVGARFTNDARDGWMSVLNYVGGAFIYIRLKYTDRLKLITSSWAKAKNRKREEEDEEGGESEHQEAPGKNEKHSIKRPKSKQGMDFQSSTSESAKNFTVPTTFDDMFMFNTAVMGFGSQAWMNEVLACFDNIVMNASNSYRLQEECDLLSLRIAKHEGDVNLEEFKAVMLASLRSLVPRTWNLAHEVAWAWLWENVARMLQAHIGKPAQHHKALQMLWGSLEPAQQQYMRSEIFAKFFTLAPAGQDFFKQSTTRLHFMADRMPAMTQEIFEDPQKMVEDISALGLRHVGYGIPTDLFAPFLTAWVQVVRDLTQDELAEESFRWAASLISRILVRVINEGSTIVMRAINANSSKLLKKAVACAPRGKRALWVLSVQVGTQYISPLMWAISTGSLEAARAVIEDLLTIRGDRGMYYYGVDTLFERHPDIVKRLCEDAPELLTEVLDRLIWRSRVTNNGLRRVNYYVKHLIVDEKGGFSKALEWVVLHGDPQIACHPIVVLAADLCWNRLAARIFIWRKAWLVATLLVYVLSQSSVENIDGSRATFSFRERTISLITHLFVYVFNMGQLLYSHARSTCRNIKDKNFVKVGCLKLPKYLTKWSEAASLALTLAILLMCCTEPLFYCLHDYNPDKEDALGLFTDRCEAGKSLTTFHTFMSMMGMTLYFVLLVDLAVFNNHVAAFVLVCGRVLTEVLLFVGAVLFVSVAVAFAVSTLQIEHGGFDNVATCMLSLVRMSLGMYPGESFEELTQEPLLLMAVIVYVLLCTVFLANLLIAQLNCSYQTTHCHLLGLARLSRGQIVVDCMALASTKRWEKFLQSLSFDDRLEFNEGDIGVAGGIQDVEPAYVNARTAETIRRYGGSTDPSLPWPDDEPAKEEEDPYVRLERLLERTLKKVGKSARPGESGLSGSSHHSKTGGGSSGASSTGSHGR